MPLHELALKDTDRATAWQDVLGIDDGDEALDPARIWPQPARSWPRSSSVIQITRARRPALRCACRPLTCRREAGRTNEAVSQPRF
jgi:hypothetical protein